MFWSDWGRYGKIERADLTGENRRSLVSLSSKRFPIPVVIDLSAERVYWMNKHSLYYTRFGGSYKRYVQSIRENINPVDMALYGDRLYWVDRNGRSIHWFNMTQLRHYWWSAIDMPSFGHLTHGILVGAVVSDESRQPVGK